MKKWLTAAAVILLLAVFPIISWIYLKKGYEYQKQSYAQLKEYKRVDRKTLKTISINLNEQYLDGKTKVISLLDSQVLRDSILPQLLTQFEKAKKFQWIQIIDSSSMINWNLEKPSPSFIVLYLNHIEYQQVRDYFGHADYDINRGVILIDYKEMVRNHYSLDNLESLKQLVEHIAILLPRDDKE